MKKITSLFTGLAAAAALFGVAGCANQAQYVETTVAKNEFNLAGLYVEGLSEEFNGASVTINYASVDDRGDLTTSSWDGGQVAYSYTDNEGVLVGHESGKVWTKIDKVYDGDAFAAKYCEVNYEPGEQFDSFAGGTFECYITVGKKDFKVLASDGTSVQNARLSVPSHLVSEKIASRWLKVVVNGDVAVYSLSSSPIEEPKNSTLTLIKKDISSMSLDAINGTAGAKITTTAKSGDVCKYTLTITGMDADQVGMEVQFAGATIAPIALKDGTEKKYNLGDYWYGGPADVISAEDQESSNLHQTIKKADADIAELGVKAGEVYVSCTFLGQSPSWASGTEGPAIKVYKFGQENKDKVYFVHNGKEGNFFFPAEAKDKDLNLLLDVSKLPDDWWVKAPPVAPRQKICVDGIKIINAAAMTGDGLAIDAANPAYFVDADDDDERILFVPGNDWGGTREKDEDGNETAIVTTCKKFDKTGLDLEGNYTWTFDEEVEIMPNSETFKLGVRLTIPKKKFNDDTELIEYNFWNKQYGQVYTPHYLTSEYNGKHVYLIIDLSQMTNQYEYLVLSDRL